MISLRLSHGFQIVVGKHVAEVSSQPALEHFNFSPLDADKSVNRVALGEKHCKPIAL
jgi:hypothetical protein